MDDRARLYPTCGKLYPDGLIRLAKCEDYDQVKAVADCYPVSNMSMVIHMLFVECMNNFCFQFVPSLVCLN